jgi:hypothetical protein
MGDPMYGLPEPWRSMAGVEVSRSVGCITASIPLPEDLSQALVGSCGVVDSTGYHDYTPEEIAEASRLSIGAVDKVSHEWVMSVGPDGQRDQSTPFVEVQV